MAKRIAGEPMVEVLRGDQVESVHSVAAFASDSHGRTLLSMGEVDTAIFLRSSAKPFIAAAALMAGVREAFALEESEISVMAASHCGETFHIYAVRSILRKIGMKESALQCGADLPYDVASRSALVAAGIGAAPIFHNCSGKHAGILALCRLTGADTGTYMEITNTAQQYILQFCAMLSGERTGDLTFAIDGCGIPVYATSLRNAALSYVRLATLRGVDAEAARALAGVRAAMIAYPHYMSGTHDFDAALIRAANGRLVCKGGAEGVHAVAICDTGAALVAKVVDGNERARAPAVLACLKTMGAISPAELAGLDAFAFPAVLNRAGRIVGQVRAIEGQATRI
ncbi:MAG: asparaginase [Candidatus Eremiobacteraeota bacterium]|nr:asparaginase [Candidatus Eremiobacteraeota bacterium]